MFVSASSVAPKSDFKAGVGLSRQTAWCKYIFCIVCRIISCGLFGSTTTATVSVSVSISVRRFGLPLPFLSQTCESILALFECVQSREAALSDDSTPSPANEEVECVLVIVEGEYYC